jgi:nucleoside-diphosphate-sugar epimerase
MRVLIIGCGYVGLPLGVELVRQGHEVFGLRRSAAAEAQLLAAGIRPLAGDVTKPESLAGLPNQFDWIVNCVASGGGEADSYRQIYREGTANLLAWLAAHPPKKFVYTSSTGVYGQTDGSAVKETSPTEPAAETAKVLVETEKLLLAAVPGHYFARGGNLRAGARLCVQAIHEERGAHRRGWLPRDEHDSPRRPDWLHHRRVEKRAGGRDLQCRG